VTFHLQESDSVVTLWASLRWIITERTAGAYTAQAARRQRLPPLNSTIN
jgi:hypothetical protein